MALSDMQLEFCRLFRSLPSSSRFILVGGAGLLVTGISSRPTRDLDFITDSRGADLLAIIGEIRTLLLDRDWTMREVLIGDSFCRLEIAGSESIVVDLSVDSDPIMDTVETLAGVSLHPLELAARKLTALYSRAEARDFVDVYVAAKILDLEEIFRLARRIDSGLSEQRLTEMLISIDRFTDEELAVDSTLAKDIRRFFAEWKARLEK